MKIQLEITLELRILILYIDKLITDKLRSTVCLEYTKPVHI